MSAPGGKTNVRASSATTALSFLDARRYAINSVFGRPVDVPNWETIDGSRSAFTIRF
jgi:hypothetical protein